MPQTAKKQSSPIIETIQGIIIRRIFYNADNGYCVLAVSPADGGEDIKMSGHMASIREGDEYKFTGSWSNHPKYGRQFKFTEAELILPTGAAGLAKYLSGVTAGVGIAKARKIIEALGEDALEKLKTNSEVLNSLDFLTEEQKVDIMKDLTENSIQAELAALICREGIGPGMVAKIYAKYGTDSVKVVKENPYVLADEVWGIGFLKADAIAQAVGIAPNSPYRVEAALNYVLQEAANEGHVFLQPNDIVQRLIGRKGLIEASGVEIADIAKANQKLIDDGRCVRDGDAVYYKPLYIAECTVAEVIKRLLNTEVKDIPDLDKLIAETEKAAGIEYETLQKEAIKTALSSGFSIITGGPGTGKSTITKAIVDIYHKVYPNNEIHLAAPTGRAAKRLAEATGRTAKTIHRLLRYNPSYGGFEFGHDNPLYGPGLLVLDEVSMVDVELMAHLLEAVNDLQVVFIGDQDQLPSVGPGSVLRDCIASGRVPTVKLEFNYRQAGGSVIAAHAHAICRGEVPELTNQGDFEFVPVEDAEQAKQVIEGLVRQALEAGYKKTDFQVLSPMYRGDAGITKLNEMVREIVNPPREGQVNFGPFRIGDRVLCVKNNYELGTFNGDIGVVVSIEPSKMQVEFDGYIVDVPYEYRDQFTLGYAVSVHKSQGSEYPIVFLTLVKGHYMMLVRQILYTAVTRAKNRLVLVADPYAVKKAVQNNKVERRWSMLAERIRGKQGGMDSV